MSSIYVTTACPGPAQSGPFDDPTWYCPIDYRPVDQAICTRCRETWDPDRDGDGEEE